MRPALQFGMIVVGAVLVVMGVGALALLFTPDRALMLEAELEELGIFPSILRGNSVWIAFYIGLPAGIFLLGLAVTDHTYLLSNQRAGRS